MKNLKLLSRFFAPSNNDSPTNSFTAKGSTKALNFAEWKSEKYADCMLHKLHFSQDDYRQYQTKIPNGHAHNSLCPPENYAYFEIEMCTQSLSIVGTYELMDYNNSFGNATRCCAWAGYESGWRKVQVSPFNDPSYRCRYDYCFDVVSGTLTIGKSGEHYTFDFKGKSKYRVFDNDREELNNGIIKSESDIEIEMHYSGKLN
ncbi:MAG: hypothetical protein ACK5LR_00255 [Mangrovibacterium sp.]